MDRLVNSLELMRSSWEILKKDKERLFIPIISGILMTVLMALFFVPIFMIGKFNSTLHP